MQAKHTPAPWKLNIDEDTGMNDSGCILDSVGRVLVSDIYGTGRFNGEADANARLIAAAPELLEALQAFVDYHEGDFPSEEEDAVDGRIPEMAKAMAAIAKATNPL